MKVSSKSAIVYEFDGKTFNGQGRISRYVGINISTFGSYLRKNQHNADEAFKRYCADRNINPEEWMNNIHNRQEEESAKSKQKIRPVIITNTNEPVTTIDAAILRSSELMLNEYRIYKDYIKNLNTKITQIEASLNTMRKMSDDIQTRFDAFERTYFSVIESIKNDEKEADK